MKGRLFSFVLSTSLLVVAASSQATIVNISSQLGQNPDEVTVGSLKYVGTKMMLGPGTYEITPVAPPTAGANFTAVNRFGTVSSNRGWEWALRITLGGADPSTNFTQYGTGGGMNSTPGYYEPTAAAAFSEAESLFNPITLNLATNQEVFFHWWDDNFSDNQGGLSFQVVPEPASLAVMGVGLAAFMRRRKSK